MRAHVRDGKFSELHFVKLMFKRLKEAGVSTEGVQDWGIKVATKADPALDAYEASRQFHPFYSRTNLSPRYESGDANDSAAEVRVQTLPFHPSSPVMGQGQDEGSGGGDSHIGTGSALPIFLLNLPPEPREPAEPPSLLLSHTHTWHGDRDVRGR